MAGSAGTDAASDIAPFRYGRWDRTAQALDAADERQRNHEAATVFGAEGVFDAASTRAATAWFAAPVLLPVGDLDVNPPPAAMTELAGLFGHCRLVTQSGAGHFPWLDDSAQFVSVTAAYLQ